MPDELLTVAEIAERLKVNQQTVRNWIDRGDLGGMRLGSRRVRVPARELERFIAESTAARTPTHDEAQARLAEAMAAYESAGNDREELVSALRRLAAAATTLARVLARAGLPPA